MQYVVAALAQADAADMTLQEVLRAAVDAKDPEHFDDLINTLSNFTEF